MTAPRRSPTGPPPGFHDLDQEPLAFQLALKNRALETAVEGITISDLRLPDNPLVMIGVDFADHTSKGLTQRATISWDFGDGHAATHGAVQRGRTTGRRASGGRRPCTG